MFYGDKVFIVTFVENRNILINKRNFYRRQGEGYVSKNIGRYDE